MKKYRKKPVAKNLFSDHFCSVKMKHQYHYDCWGEKFVINFCSFCGEKLIYKELPGGEKK